MSTHAQATLIDASARRRIAEDLDTTLVVEAAAGTGKTTALVSRIVSLLRSGRASAPSLVATTFTEKAAGELVVRTREALERAVGDEAPGSEARRALERAIANLETARIGTIHGLATDLLREHPIEAGLDPSFRVLAEDESAELLDRVASRWLEERLHAPPPALQRWLRRPPSWPDTLRTALVKAVTRLAQQRDLDAPWRRPSFDREARLAEAIAAIERLRVLRDDARAQMDVSRIPSWDNLYESLDTLVRTLDEGALAERLASERDLEGLESQLVALAKLKPKRGKSKMFGKRLRADVLAALDRTMEVLEAFRRDADGELAAALQPELRDAVSAYEAEKRRRGFVDYTDLLFELRRVLVSHRAVRVRLQARFSHVLVDEVQDTDPVQYEIVRLLCARDPEATDPHAAVPVPGKLFVVGDPKQAIYRFRRADLDAYFEHRGELVAAGAEILHLSTSFRSEPSIQAAVNRAFDGSLPEHALREYVPLAPHRAARTERPSVIVLPVPRGYGDFGTEPYGPHARASYADAVGAFVHELVSRSGWTVEEDGREVPLAAHHVAILFKRTASFGDDLLQPYVRALEARGVAVRSAERRAFFERDEIFALRTTLAAIEWVDDELSVYGALRGLYLALSDAELLAYLREHGSLHPLRVPKKLELAPGQKAPPGEDVADALRLIRSLHVGRNQRPIADTIQRLLDATRAHALLALTAHGERAIANVAAFVGLARRAEARGTLSFRRFVEDLEARIEDGKHGEVSAPDDTTLGVTLSTVHGAKGLEFPVVILADPTAPRAMQVAGSFTDRKRKLHVERIAQIAPLDLSENEPSARSADEDESRRLLYVAATRARDLLVVPSHGDGPFGGWTEPLERALRPAPSERPRDGVGVAPGCPPLGDDTVLDRPQRVLDKEPAIVVPGRYRLGASAHHVVFWGPSALALDEPTRPGVRAIELLEAPAKDATGRAPHDGGIARDKELSLARERRLEHVAPSGAALREPLSVLADRPLAVTSIELDVEEIAIALALDPRDDVGTRKLEGLVRAALVVRASLSGETQRSLDAVSYVARTFASSETDRHAARAVLAAVQAHASYAELVESAEEVQTDVWVALATLDGSLGEGRVPVVLSEGARTWAISIAIAGELAPSRARELGLAATALARDLGKDVRARLFVVG
ncbi:MAG: UvrD-helicase domain-containing protein [Sandaracinaceae bacterium]|nr:UvrD-helicase domain-containing protein [Sandaracinaceae bacterium]